MNNYPPCTWSGDPYAPWNEECEYESKTCGECIYYDESIGMCMRDVTDDYDDDKSKAVHVDEDWHACESYLSH